MTSPRLVIEHHLDVPPVVAWDAVTDAELVSGWLGHARIDAVPGGEYRLRFVGSVTGPAADGRITRLEPLRLLTIATEEIGEVTIELEPRSGGLRGTWTLLRLTAAVEPGAVARPLAETEWRAALAQLDELLRGHPVDWYRVRPTAAADLDRGADLG